MKNITYLFLALFLFAGGTSSWSQDLKEGQVPASVRATFKKLYPDTYVHEWELIKKTQLYEAEFISKGTKYEAYFTRDGQWVQTERDIKKTEIPQEILVSLAKTQYATWEIDDVEEHQSPEHKLSYEIEVEQGKQEMYLYFLPDGKLIRTVKKK